MNSLPAAQRGAGAGMSATFQNAAQVLSIGIFFSLMIVGLAAHLPSALHDGLVAHGVSDADATRVAQLPPVASLFAAFLGYNPMQHLLGPHVLAALPHAQAAELTGRGFFPSLMSGPFADALNVAFTFALVACLIAAAASLLRGGRYHHEDHPAIGGEALGPHRGLPTTATVPSGPPTGEPAPSGIAPALQRSA
jgi:hypothetical protein